MYALRAIQRHQSGGTVKCLICEADKTYDENNVVKSLPLWANMPACENCGMKGGHHRTMHPHGGPPQHPECSAYTPMILVEQVVL